jgi:pyruvate/2-oxoglutarate dehydrogenase complex dihydrolipoamide dehydrogenase (E3) component
VSGDAGPHFAREDEDAAKELARSLRKQKIKTLESTRVEGIEKTARASPFGDRT